MPLSFDTRYKMYWPCMNKHWPFQMVMSKMICAEWEFKGLTGSATFQNKGTCWKTFIGIFFVSFVMFLLLRLLILTWISESELGHYYSTPLFCANRDMHEFKLFPFIHALRYHYVFGIMMLLIMKHTVCFNLAWQWRYLTDKTGFLFIGTHCIAACTTQCLQVSVAEPAYETESSARNILCGSGHMMAFFYAH